MSVIILDAGHGGNDLGDVYGHRYEKDDNLRLTLAVGRRLQEYGYDVIYTRTTDVYLSQIDRVQIVSSSDADLILSIHRIIGEIIISQGGLGFYVDKLGGLAEMTGLNIAEELSPLGFENYSISVRIDYPLLRDTETPSLMIGIGYLNSDYDNFLFDQYLDEIADAVAIGVAKSLPLSGTSSASIDNGYSIDNDSDKLYAVQVGLFCDYKNAVNVHNSLLEKGYPSHITISDPYYAVQVGDYNDLDFVAALEFWLALEGYNTLLLAT